MKWNFTILFLLISIASKDIVNAQFRKSFNMGCKCGRSIPDVPTDQNWEFQNIYPRKCALSNSINEHSGSRYNQSCNLSSPSAYIGACYS